MGSLVKALQCGALYTQLYIHPGAGHIAAVFLEDEVHNLLKVCWQFRRHAHECSTACQLAETTNQQTRSISVQTP